MTEKPSSVSIVIPVYNEQEVLPVFHQQLVEAIAGLPYPFLILYVNDGSSDNTAEVLNGLQNADTRVEVLELSRNFGHQAALTAGMSQAQGDYILTMDGDGQHPPHLIKDMLALMDQGYDLVLTQRIEEKNVSSLKPGLHAHSTGLLTG